MAIKCFDRCRLFKITSLQIQHRPQTVAIRETISAESLRQTQIRRLKLPILVTLSPTGNSRFVALTFSRFEARTWSAGLAGYESPNSSDAVFACGVSARYWLLSDAGLHGKVATSRLSRLRAIVEPKRSGTQTATTSQTNHCWHVSRSLPKKWDSYPACRHRQADQEQY